MPPDRQTGRHFLFHFFKEDFFHENPFPTPAQHGTGAEYAADLPARFGFRRRYPPPPYVDPQELDTDNTYTYKDNNNNEYKYKYTLNDNGTATLTKFTGTDADVPKEVTKGTETYKVTAIGEYAFANSDHTPNPTLKSVNLPDPGFIQTIEDYAFYGCTSLSDITLPEGLTKVGIAAFLNTDLKTIDWPKSLTTVGDSAFHNKYNSDPIKIITYHGTETNWQTLLNSDTVGGTTVATSNPQLVPKDTEHPKGVDLHCAHTVTFNANGHGTDPNNQVVDKQDVQYEGCAKKPSDPTAEGYTFKAWYTESEGGEKFVFENSPITKDTKLYAHWEEEEKKPAPTPENPGNSDQTPSKPNEPTTPEQPGTQQPGNSGSSGQTTTPEVPAVEEDDTAAIGYAAAAVTAAFVGWGAYRIGSEVYLKYLLPKDVLLPQNRIQLAELLWEDAGRPAPADAAAAYTDVDDTDARQAARWAVENGLLTLPDAEKPEEFAPYRSVSYAKSARAWNKAQQLKENAAR